MNENKEPNNKPLDLREQISSCFACVHIVRQYNGKRAQMLEQEWLAQAHSLMNKPELQC